MELPRTIRIGGFDWTVEEQDDVAREGDIYGSTHFTTQKIFLAPNLMEQKRKQTLLHEICHAVWLQSSLCKDKEMKDSEEKVIHTLSMGLYQVLKDNPDII